MPEDEVSITDVADMAALPAEARALFGGDAYSTEAWFKSVTQAALPAGGRAGFQLAWSRGALLGVFPMLRTGRGFAALTTPYTSLWSPLLRTGLAPGVIAAIGQALGRVWRAWPVTRLEALDGQAPWLAPLRHGLGRSGLVPLRFGHFGNWYVPVAGLGWDRYLAGRPGALRTTVARSSKRLIGGMAARFTMVGGDGDLDAALRAYAAVYAASWKQPEPFPDFIPSLIRSASGAGTLRFGLLHLGSKPVAAQFWLLHPRSNFNGAGGEGGGIWAGLQKLAHDAAYQHLSPGTVLTALMVRHLLDRDGCTELDFGRGDDDYKRLWTGKRRQREGLVLAAPWRAGGLSAMARHWAGRAAKATALDVVRSHVEPAGPPHLL